VPPCCYLNAERAEERFGDLARRYAAALDQVDELGAAAVEALHELGADGAELLGAALAEGIDSRPEAPEPLAAFCRSLERPPFPVDHELIDLGTRAIMRHGFGYAAATRQSLFWGYSNGAAIKPLAWTGLMRSPDAALSRLVKTGTWLHAVITPGAIRFHAVGWQATARVRLLHARLRARLRESGKWDAEAWGAPLNVADSAFTLLEFTWMPLRLLRRLGFTYSEDEVAGVYALWRLVGHLVGVPPELNPAGEEDAQRLLELRELTAGPPDEQSLELVRALLDSNLRPGGTPVQRWAGRGLGALDRALAWHNLPAGYADRLGIPPTRAQRLLPALIAGFRTVEALRRRRPRTEGWLIDRNEALIRRGQGMLARQSALTRRAGHGGRPVRS
jgi:hypothetical protein